MTIPRIERRRTRVADARTQTRIVRSIAIWPLSLLLLAAIAMWWLSHRLFDEAQQTNAELPTLGLLVMTQFLFVVATGAAVVLRSFHYSHRVVGPAMRIAEALRRLRQGEAGFRVSLRHGDELGDVAAELDLLLASRSVDRASPREATPSQTAIAKACQGQDGCEE